MKKLLMSAPVMPAEPETAYSELAFSLSVQAVPARNAAGQVMAGQLTLRAARVLSSGEPDVQPQPLHFCNSGDLAGGSAAEAALAEALAEAVGKYAAAVGL